MIQAARSHQPTSSSCQGAMTHTFGISPLMYDVPLLDVEISLVLTNTAPIGPYRGAGREQAAYI
ncbi:MAG: molybdopterin cofactor-binding domain-containing protein, partial [Chloroflexota bacterium]